MFAAAEFQHGNERAVAECFHVVLYCRVTALSHNIRAHDEMVNLDKRTLSSAPWGGDPSLRLAPVRLALPWCPLFWQGWIGRNQQETLCAEFCETGCSVGLSVLCSPQRHREQVTPSFCALQLSACLGSPPSHCHLCGRGSASHTEFVFRCCS